MAWRDRGHGHPPTVKTVAGRCREKHAPRRHHISCPLGPMSGPPQIATGSRLERKSQSTHGGALPATFQSKTPCRVEQRAAVVDEPFASGDAASGLRRRILASRPGRSFMTQTQAQPARRVRAGLGKQTQLAGIWISTCGLRLLFSLGLITVILRM